MQMRSGCSRDGPARNRLRHSPANCPQSRPPQGGHVVAAIEGHSSQADWDGHWEIGALQTHGRMLGRVLVVRRAGSGFVSEFETKRDQ